MSKGVWLALRPRLCITNSFPVNIDGSLRKMYRQIRISCQDKKNHKTKKSYNYVSLDKTKNESILIEPEFTIKAPLTTSHSTVLFYWYLPEIGLLLARDAFPNSPQYPGAIGNSFRRILRTASARKDETSIFDLFHGALL